MRTQTTMPQYYGPANGSCYLPAFFPREEPRKTSPVLRCIDLKVDCPFLPLAGEVLATREHPLCCPEFHHKLPAHAELRTNRATPEMRFIGNRKRQEKSTETRARTPLSYFSSFPRLRQSNNIKENRPPVFVQGATRRRPCLLLPLRSTSGSGRPWKLGLNEREEKKSGTQSHNPARRAAYLVTHPLGWLEENETHNAHFVAKTRSMHSGKSRDLEDIKQRLRVCHKQFPRAEVSERAAAPPEESAARRRAVLPAGDEKSQTNGYLKNNDF